MVHPIRVNPTPSCKPDIRQPFRPCCLATALQAKGTSKEFAGFLAACVRREPASRATVGQLRAHAFVRGTSLAPLQKRIRRYTKAAARLQDATSPGEHAGGGISVPGADESFEHAGERLPLHGGRPICWDRAVGGRDSAPLLEVGAASGPLVVSLAGCNRRRLCMVSQIVTCRIGLHSCALLYPRAPPALHQSRNDGASIHWDVESRDDGASIHGDVASPGIICHPVLPSTRLLPTPPHPLPHP